MQSWNIPLIASFLCVGEYCTSCISISKQFVHLDYRRVCVTVEKTTQYGQNYKVFRRDGELIKKQGLWEGSWSKYKSVSFEWNYAFNGKMSGLCTWWHRPGCTISMSGMYGTTEETAGKPVGVHTWWDENGIKTRETTYGTTKETAGQIISNQYNQMRVWD